MGVCVNNLSKSPHIDLWFPRTLRFLSLELEAQLSARGPLHGYADLNQLRILHHVIIKD